MTNRLRSYGAAMKDMGVEDLQLCGQWRNNRAENSHQPFRLRLMRIGCFGSPFFAVEAIALIVRF